MEHHALGGDCRLPARTGSRFGCCTRGRSPVARRQDRAARGRRADRSHGRRPRPQRLLVAALGNGTLEIVDLAGGHRVKQVTGLREPQGVGYAQKADLVVVASAGDGSVRFFRGDDLAPAGSFALGNDADNVRIDPAHRQCHCRLRQWRACDHRSREKIENRRHQARCTPGIIPARPRVRPDLRQRSGCRPNRGRRPCSGKTGGELDGTGSASKFPARSSTVPAR